ncbi:MAG: NeuD/PglB/VioB family sugar acetyltransferase [Planctomycetota bacterium]|jgi:sugar O-acyltransferase (sialic acid O-acetyltransferase NeuD family)
MAVEVQNLLILGTGAFAMEMADTISDIRNFRLAGFIENMDRRRCDQQLDSLPVYWVDDIARLAKDHWAVCSLGTTKRRAFIEHVESHNIRFATPVHPAATVSSKSSLGSGTFICPGVIIASNTRLGRHVRVNRGALIGHDTAIDDYVTIQPGANIAGMCTIGQSTYIGMGATIIDRISVGSNSVIGAGAVVIEDVPDRVVVVGVPAGIIKENIDGK